MQNIKHTTEVFSGIYTVSLQRNNLSDYMTFSIINLATYFFVSDFTFTVQVLPR